MRISGGGRCNVTNHCFDVNELLSNYPRGAKELRQVFHKFSPADTIDWFKKQGISLKTEPDGRMFPISDSSETIIDCFLTLAQKYSIDLRLHSEVNVIRKKDQHFEIKTNNGTLVAAYVVCAMGGHPKIGSYSLIANLGHTIVSPIPSLFTINLPGAAISKQLQGLAVQQAEVSISGTRYKWQGPLLITHWGLSGPAVLKLSAFAAEDFHLKNYESDIQVNWLAPLKADEIFTALQKMKEEQKRVHPHSATAFGLPRRLWEFLCLQTEITNDAPMAEIADKKLRNLAETLGRSVFKMSGKTTFKEEFVTCGGVLLKEVDFKTMESKRIPGLYLCGEILNVDGITGGFNFQNAWSTAFVAATAVSQKLGFKPGQ